MAHNSTRAAKPAKPRPDFLLFPHATGRWAKKVRGNLLYFGKVADDSKGEKALLAWVEEKDYCLAHGRRPPANRPGAVAVKDAVNQFLAHKESLKDSGEITPRTFHEYEATGKRVAAEFGRLTPVEHLAATDFGKLRAAIAKEWGPIRLGNEIQRVRSIFKYAYDCGLIDKVPRYGAEFKKPSAKVLRKNRAARGLRMFEREELLAVLDLATVNQKAMILLGVNCGLGNSDVGNLPTKALDLKKGWIDYARGKTGIDRRVPLWPETVEALKAAQAQRHAPTDPAHEPLFFISRHGKPYTDKASNGYRVGWEALIAIGKAVIKSADGKTQTPVKRKGLSFYSLRHTFQTVAEGARDLAAVQAIMGHAASSSDMSAAYRERVDEERLQAVVEHVRKWLFPVVTKDSKK